MENDIEKIIYRVFAGNITSVKKLKLIHVISEHVDKQKPKDVQRVSGDGVFFKCSGCEYEPEMSSDKDDLLNMNYCPDCGGKFKNPA